jgi:D-alanine-D-alanine ligase
MKLTVAVIQGGPSSEAEVSRASAKSVARALETAGHRVLRLELDAYLAESLRTNGVELAFPVSHGAVGEDGSLQGLLECLDLPYVGSNVLASALAMNKRAAKVMFAEAGLPIARGVSLVRAREDANAAAERALKELGDKVVVKPCSSGSAIGVTRFDGGASAADLARAIEEAWTLDAVVLVERFARGSEGTCGVLDLHGKDARALPPTEVRSGQDAFYTYQARYAPGRSEHLCPPPWDEAVVRRVQDVAVAAHHALGCRDLCRVDFVVGERPEDVVLLEVNTMPGFTDTSLYPEAAGVAGIAMPELCGALVASAKERGATPRNQAVPLPR